MASAAAAVAASARTPWRAAAVARAAVRAVPTRFGTAAAAASPVPVTAPPAAAAWTAPPAGGPCCRHYRAAAPPCGATALSAANRFAVRCPVASVGGGVTATTPLQWSVADARRTIVVRVAQSASDGKQKFHDDAANLRAALAAFEKKCAQEGIDDRINSRRVSCATCVRMYSVATKREGAACATLTAGAPPHRCLSARGTRHRASTVSHEEEDEAPREPGTQAVLPLQEGDRRRLP